MAKLEFTKFETVTLKNHSELNEKWVQDRIADDPSLLGLGDLILLNEELIQPGGGRLDLLLFDSDNEDRYEVEIQLGKVDESHIIRTLEYWDIERKRYPQYGHIAVIIAEEVTGRFLNVISLFNGYIPLIAIQMKALKFGDNITLDFTKILDRVKLGIIEPPQLPADRSYWEQKGSPATVKLADKVLKLIQTFAPDFQLNYNKGYIGLAVNGVASNFAVFYPKKHFLRMGFKHTKSEELEKYIEDAGFDFSYTKSGAYRIRLYKEDIDKNADFLTKILKAAYGKTAE